MAIRRPHQHLQVKDNISADNIIRAVTALTQNRVLVGVPAVNGYRSQGPGAGKISNASLAYIHNFGSPAQNIPQREFLYSGMATVRELIIRRLKLAADAAMMGSRADVIAILHGVGLTAQNAIRAKITAGPFVALAPYTLYMRRSRNHQGTRPLLEYGLLRRSITYVLSGNWF